MAVYREILEDQLAVLQELQADLHTKIKKPIPGKVYEDYTNRIVILSGDIRKVSREINELMKKESTQK